ncbi:Transcriptional regulatory protein [Enterobacter sp. FY-07]|uniref:winged helix-turn-helix domain-containing protein n=1 Tax=Kosakonia oryzendophytica TaxID=1005665 RepID=UPI000777D7AB|nr:winged helix-turn-helix domain-containing protein [Kosakonia oryzendophytica]AMO51281.1 Transcriptional regulatory protein [Enterobacter sp. FY-07]WBT58166.1 winged helix-turn-helix domain-containing protein [Kosakonia oryzendophytica]
MYLINNLVEFNPDSKSLTNRLTGRTLHLQLPASLCFLYLITHPGEVISQNDLMKVGWGDRNDVTTPNAFYQAILTLRNALEVAGLPRDVVKTISRRGLTLSNTVSVEVLNTPQTVAIHTVPQPVVQISEPVPVISAKKNYSRWLIASVVILVLLSIINGWMLYNAHLPMPFKDYLTLNTTPSSGNDCRIFYAANERTTEYYTNLLNKNTELCANNDYLFLTGYSQADRIVAFACDKDARVDRTAFCSSHYFWTREQ